MKRVEVVHIRDETGNEKERKKKKKKAGARGGAEKRENDGERRSSPAGRFTVDGLIPGDLVTVHAYASRAARGREKRRKETYSLRPPEKNEEAGETGNEVKPPTKASSPITRGPQHRR